MTLKMSLSAVPIEERFMVGAELELDIWFRLFHNSKSTFKNYTTSNVTYCISNY